MKSPLGTWERRVLTFSQLLHTMHYHFQYLLLLFLLLFLTGHHAFEVSFSSGNNGWMKLRHFTLFSDQQSRGTFEKDSSNYNSWSWKWMPQKHLWVSWKHTKILTLDTGAFNVSTPSPRLVPISFPTKQYHSEEELAELAANLIEDTNGLRRHNPDLIQSTLKHLLLTDSSSSSSSSSSINEVHNTN